MNTSNNFQTPSRLRESFEDEDYQAAHARFWRRLPHTRFWRRLPHADIPRSCEAQEERRVGVVDIEAWARRHDKGDTSSIRSAIADANQAKS